MKTPTPEDIQFVKTFAAPVLFDLLGKGAMIYGLTTIHPGLGLAYGGYVISQFAHDKMRDIETKLERERMKLEFIKLAGSLDKPAPSTATEKVETLH